VVLVFEGIVSSRTSGGRTDGPPGETEILGLNPERRTAIIAATGWPDLVAGTLNLEVAAQSVDQLLSCVPVFRENGASVRYPMKYAHIPRRRGGYLYYRARIRNGDKMAAALIRRPVNPIAPRVEAFSDQMLRESLGVSDGTSVICEVYDAQI
jgi:hypothetical protein